jgi:hypothetical protein
MKQGDIVGDFDLASGPMPSGAIKDDNGMMTALDL